MIVSERKTKNVSNSLDEFGSEMPDGRLTEQSNGKKYRLREAIIRSKELGRPLSKEEMRKFEVK